MAQGVFTTKRLEEGATAFVATALYFTSKAILNTWLTNAGRQHQAVYSNKAVVMKNILQLNRETEAYGILVGLAGEVNAPRETKKPNAKLQCFPAVGPNAGCLKVTICTMNKVGMAAGAELLLNYGDDYDFTAADPVERTAYRGPIDAFVVTDSSATESGPPTESAGVPGTGGPKGDKEVMRKLVEKFGGENARAGCLWCQASEYAFFVVHNSGPLDTTLFFVHKLATGGGKVSPANTILLKSLGGNGAGGQV